MERTFEHDGSNPMTALQKATLNVSEARAALLALDDEATAEDITPLEKRLRDSEAQHRRALLLAEESEIAAVEDRRPLSDRCEVRAYLTEAITGQQVTGAEAELRKEALGADSYGFMPLELLLPIEERVDAATVAPSDVGANMQSVAARVFARGVSAFLGVNMPTVPAGETLYPILSAGHTPAMTAAGTARDATAATFATVTAEPKRLTGRYLVRIEDMAKFAQLEVSLRNDLRLAMTNAMDNQVINGPGGNAPNIDGFLNRLAAPTPAPSAVLTFGDMLAAHVSAVDGLYATSLQECRMVIGPATYQRGATQFTSNGDVASTDYLLARSGGLRSSALVPAEDSTTKIQHGIVHGVGGVSRAFAPVWSGIQLIKDPYTDAASGEVSITAHLMWDFVISGGIDTAWREVSFKTAA